MQSTLETRALAQAIVDYIEQHPDQHSQEKFVDTYDIKELESKVEGNVCGSTMCIAGTAVWLTEGIAGMAYHIRNGNWTRKAGDLLGLNESETYDLFLGVMDDEAAVNATRAIANGDVDKFNAVVAEYYKKYES